MEQSNWIHCNHFRALSIEKKFRFDFWRFAFANGTTFSGISATRTTSRGMLNFGKFLTGDFNSIQISEILGFAFQKFDNVRLFRKPSISSLLNGQYLCKNYKTFANQPLEIAPLIHFVNIVQQSIEKLIRIRIKKSVIVSLQNIGMHIVPTALRTYCDENKSFF